MDDTQIIDLYWDRDQGAITATAGKYGSFLLSLIHISEPTRPY